ncbi:hypothetical protein G9C85_06625 [Halorubellus sp. JP-L1]|uniref:hypothetical protein n=1 Tax=Halorubellus sp. JP-L1 TaxID=2715753 RepID=UPI001408F8D5|nr:hypothetical protein [Halorubellus sp. JP-L1]NHN41310.1 hypothetical protein [Halorubellus sp. JP-L1]
MTGKHHGERGDGDDGRIDGDASESSAEEPLGEFSERVVDDADGTDDGGVGDETPALEAGADAGRSGPLGDLAADVDGRRERSRSADDELFDEVDVGEVDADELWAQVESDDRNVTADGERAIRKVEKRKYCQGCPHFATPPDVHCSHEGTDIIEQVDMAHFEVADCPVVLEDERLEDVTTD